MALVGTIGNIETLVVNGRTFVDVANLIILSGRTGGSAVTSKSTLRTASGSAGYAVSSGKTLKVVMLEFQNNSASAIFPLVYYSDNDLGIAGNTAPTNPSYIFGDSTGGSVVLSAGIGTKTYLNCNWNIVQSAPNKFVSIDDTDATNGLFLTVYGYET